ncbi:MAG: hypothetical protein LBT79_08105 [Elusimicrobiota bacterium]|nr:hypothetical protein [Elusimicrobiota bacterium]
MDKYYKHYYLIDASAFGRYVDTFNPKSQPIKRNIFSDIIAGNFYYIPQFCIPEVFNMFAKWRYDTDYNKRHKRKKLNKKEYEYLYKLFISYVHNRVLLYPYDLHRYHNLNCHKIYMVENNTDRQQPTDRLSAFDILIIAMGIELQKIHGKNNITILSCDKILIRIANKVNVNVQYYQ